MEAGTYEGNHYGTPRPPKHPPSEPAESVTDFDPDLPHGWEMARTGSGKIFSRETFSKIFLCSVHSFDLIFFHQTLSTIVFYSIHSQFLTEWCQIKQVASQESSHIRVKNKKKSPAGLISPFRSNLLHWSHQWDNFVDSSERNTRWKWSGESWRTKEKLYRNNGRESRGRRNVFTFFHQLMLSLISSTCKNLEK